MQRAVSRNHQADRHKGSHLGPKKARRRRVGNRGILAHTGHLGWRQHIEVGGVGQQVQHHDQRRTTDQCPWYGSRRVPDLAANGREYGPAVVTPECTQHGRTKASNSQPGTFRYALAAAIGPRQRVMPPVPIGQKEGTKADH